MSAARRRAAGVLDALLILVLATIAGAGSFAHIRDTAAEHGQKGPMSWAVAVCIDLTCVLAARERQRDKRLAAAADRVSWPGVVLAGGVLLSLAANLAQAQPDAWGRITAATPCGAFLIAVSLLERRASHPPAVPARDDGGDVSSWPGRPFPGRPRRAAGGGRPPRRRRVPGQPRAADHPRCAARPAGHLQPGRLRSPPPAPPPRREVTAPRPSEPAPPPRRVPPAPRLGTAPPPGIATTTPPSTPTSRR